MADRVGEAHHRRMESTTTANHASDLTAVRALRRSARQRLVGGVAGGLAEYFDVDVVLVRVAMVALVFVGGFAVPLYVAAWLLVPEEGRDESVAERLLGPVSGFGEQERSGDGTAR